MGWNPVEVKQLVRAELEDPPEPRCHGIEPSVDQRRECAVQFPGVSQHARRQLVREAAVPLVQRSDRLVPRGVERRAAGNPVQDGERRAAGGQAGQPSIPRVGDDGTATSRRGIRPAR